MKNSKDPRIKILVIVAAALIFGGVIMAFATSGENNSLANSQNLDVPKMEFKETRYNFGDVSMANGLAKHIFPITNIGEGALKISDISTSCMCTKAVLEINGERSPAFGMAGHGISSKFWSANLAPGQTANLEVIFDPNAHGPNATGPITRKITIFSNDNGKNNTKHNFMFTANVIK